MRLPRIACRASVVVQDVPEVVVPLSDGEAGSRVVQQKQTTVFGVGVPPKLLVALEKLPPPSSQMQRDRAP